MLDGDHMMTGNLALKNTLENLKNDMKCLKLLSYLRWDIVITALILSLSHPIIKHTQQALNKYLN